MVWVVVGGLVESRAEGRMVVRVFVKLFKPLSPELLIHDKRFELISL